MAKIKYLKLGEKAAGFSDPYSGLNVSGKMVVMATAKQTRYTKVAKALLGGHLVAATQEEYEEWVEFEASTRTDVQSKAVISNKELKEENTALKARLAELEGEKSPIDKMNSKALVKFYKDTYDVTEDEIAEFEEKELDDKRAFLKELED